MANNIILAESLVDSIENLSKKERKIVWNKLSYFSNNSDNTGFSIHSLDRSNCDDSFKSAKLNRDLRLILSQQGDKYILLYVDHHDDAYNWAEGKFLDLNSFGALYIKDNNIKYNEVPHSSSYEDFYTQLDNSSSLLKEKDVGLKELLKLDIDDEFAEHLLSIKDTDAFVNLVTRLPEEIGEGLIDVIIGNKSITQLYNELQDQEIKNDGSIEDALKHKDSKRRFYFVEDEEELSQIFNNNIEKWRLFLHPQQEDVVKRHFTGPALIEGGPGTGKTVVGLHRAAYLAKNVYDNQDNKILLATFSRKLAKYIESKLSDLIKQKNVPDIINVYGVDSLIYRLINQYILCPELKLLDDFKLKEMMESIFIKLEPSIDLDMDFYITEYKEVIQRYFIRSLDEYLEVDRSGRIQGLNPSQRKIVWPLFAELLKLKREYGFIDYEDRAFIVEKALDSGKIQSLYDSIIVDEAQDLSPVKLRVLKKLAKNQDNNLFLLSDKNQRIYKLDSWKSDIGINIVGRSYYLTLNYRTTKQIREYADMQFIKTNNSADYLREYKSIYLGPEPIIKGFNTNFNQQVFIINLIKRHIDRGIQPFEIGLITVTHSSMAKWQGVLEFNKLDSTLIKGEIFPRPGNGISISTLHGSKGLEYRVVLLVDYDQIEKEMKQDIANEWYNQQKIRQIECLKYVACTRARDELVVTFLEDKEELNNN